MNNMGVGHKGEPQSERPSKPESQNIAELEGIVDIYSMTYGTNHYTFKPQTVYDICIYYNDGQIIRTEIAIEGHMLGYREVHEAIQKYFKGDLKIKHY